MHLHEGARTGKTRHMNRAVLSIDLNAVAANWRALDAMSSRKVQTSAVVKADAYGLGLVRLAKSLRAAGVKRFFVAQCGEGAKLRRALGPEADILVFAGHMAGDGAQIARHRLTPMLNSPEQLKRHLSALPGHAFGVQLDSGMNRLGFAPADWDAARALALNARPVLLMSHLANAEFPDHAGNAAQLARFRAMTDGTGVARSLAATGGILLGPDYHFDLTRPGIGLYGGLPFGAAQAVVRLSIPIIQVREVAVNESVGYGDGWRAHKPTRIATLSAGYADGLLRTLSNAAMLYDGDTPCALVGRVSMDLIGADISHLSAVPDALDILCEQQGIDRLAGLGGTIGYEILTSLGARYQRRYKGR